MVGEAMAPNYSMHDNAISDLGVIPETASLFTITMVVAGVLNIAGGYFFYLSHKRLGTLILYVLAGTGAIGAGLISLDSPLGVHGLFALLAFLFFNAEAIASSRMAGGPMKAISIIAGVIGLAFVFVMFLGDAGVADIFGPIGHGGSERMIVFPPLLWAIGFGGYLMASRTDVVEAR
jgi:hypothetical membrane protein